jgi:hypothetical protein
MHRHEIMKKRDVFGMSNEASIKRCELASDALAFVDDVRL